MGCVQQAVLEFDEAVQAPWRPRLVAVPDVGTVEAPMAAQSGARPVIRPHPSRRSPSRVGVCRPPERPVPTADRRRPLPPAARAPRPGAAAGRRARLRLTRRARRLAVVLALAAGVALGSWIAPLLSGNGGGDLRLAGVSSVVVEPGDTLWSIASSVDEGRDVRAVIDEIQELNGLSGVDLVPGQVLQLP
jgi:nucleoid-associated protein YgaU